MFTLRNLAIIAVAAILIAGGYFLLRTPKNDTGELIKVTKGEVVEEVNVTGKIKAADDVQLGFEKPGRITQVNVEVGDRVAQGAVLAVLDQSDLLAQLAQA